MALVDNPDLKKGFWIGLGLLAAVLVLNLVMALLSHLRGGAK